MKKPTENEIEEREKKYKNTEHLKEQKARGIKNNARNERINRRREETNKGARKLKPADRRKANSSDRKQRTRKKSHLLRQNGRAM